MKYLQKGKEPDSLTEHRCKTSSIYDNYKEKDDLRLALLKEQGYICCYCMQEINMDKMKIEHWKSQSKYPDNQSDYKNLLGACLGNEGKPKHLQHCDTKKGEEIITINPIDKNCENSVKFRLNGEIYSDDDTINKDLDETLNLNIQALVNNRKAVLEEAVKNFSKKHSKGTWTKEIIEREINRWTSLYQEIYRPYCRIVVYYFQKKLSKYCK